MRSKQPVRASIDTLHRDGYGLSESGQLAVYGALPGESVVAQPITRRRRRLYARIKAVEENLSADRVSPFCPAADYCGGCSLQHLEASKQIRFKEQTLIRELGEYAPSELLPPLTGPVRNYRSKARLGVRLVHKKGKVLVGFREKMAPYIAEIDDCGVLAKPVDSMIEPMARLIEELDARTRIPQIEVAVGDDRSALVIRHLDPLSRGDEEKIESFGSEYEVDIYLQPKGPDSAYRACGPDGPERLSYRLPAFGLEYQFHPLDFIQVNREINRKLVSFAIDKLELSKSDRVFDLFCGVGNFSLAMATRCQDVTGVEMSAESVARAWENAQANALDNCRFIGADLFDDGTLFSGNFKANKVFLDPPRSGALAVSQKLASDKVERVVYVSCNPETLAQDAKVLVESGYRLDCAGVIDMFPHTTHVESIACFTV